ncbi:hypothetical protein L596_025553 [Steinernema carpocapsae]|uniref:Uncharacterized protein n=1 Tax=Steinernema carpocapsae TaxID=34508 RepID=A0A4U5M829_STECR|nr:hypothetical protein L596_025553 [Steinernema carpocapsae]
MIAAVPGSRLREWSIIVQRTGNVKINRKVTLEKSFSVPGGGEVLERRGVVEVLEEDLVDEFEWNELHGDVSKE